MSAIQSIGQIAIAVSDLKKATEFYRNTLGLTFLFDAPNLSFFDCGGVRLMLTPLQGKESDHHTSVIYYKVDDIQPVIAAFKDQGITIEQEATMVAPMPDHELWMAFIRDPDENLIGIMSEVPL